MSQYKTGFVSVSNGSQVVTGTGTLWLSNVSPGDGFTVAGTGVPYTVGSVDSDTQITLNANYTGPSGSGLAYTIWRDFEANTGAPEMSQGDIETATIFTRAIRALGQRLGLASETVPGIVLKATTQNIDDAVQDKHPDAFAVKAHLDRYGLGNAEGALVSDANTLLKTGFYAGGGSSALNYFGNTRFGPLTVKRRSSSVIVQESQFLNDSTNLDMIRGSNDTGASYTPWFLRYNQGNVLGTVSQSGGLPTGAIIERGSNANGAYVKFADGTMETATEVTIDFSSAILALDITLPAAFANNKFGITTTRVTAGANDGELDCTNRIGRFAEGVSRARLGLDSDQTISGFTTDILVKCSGRWF